MYSRQDSFIILKEILKIFFVNEIFRLFVCEDQNPHGNKHPFQKRVHCKISPSHNMCTTQLLPLSSRALISVTGPPIIAFPSLFPSIFFPSASPLAFHFFRRIPLFWKQEHFPLFPSFFISHQAKSFSVYTSIYKSGTKTERESGRWREQRVRKWEKEKGRE